MTTDREKALFEIKSRFKKDGVGLGDVIHKVTDALGIEHCDECEKRRQRYNRWLRFKGADE